MRKWCSAFALAASLHATRLALLMEEGEVSAHGGGERKRAERRQPTYQVKLQPRSARKSTPTHPHSDTHARTATHPCNRHLRSQEAPGRDAPVTVSTTASSNLNAVPTTRPAVALLSASIPTPLAPVIPITLAPIRYCLEPILWEKVCRSLRTLLRNISSRPALPAAYVQERTAPLSLNKMHTDVGRHMHSVAKRLD